MALPRILTSVFLIPLVLASIWFGSIPFFIFVLTVGLFCAWEYSLMAEGGGYPNQLYMLLLGCGLVLGGLFLDGLPGRPWAAYPGFAPVFVLSCFLFFIREFFRRDFSYSLLRVITTISGLVICGVFMGHLLLIRELTKVGGDGSENAGRLMTFFLVAVIWSLDTGCWLTGRLAGRTPLAARISPKKTLEGAVGGTMVACGVAWFFREAFMRSELSAKEALALALIITVTAQFSDLIESLMKRSFGVKDSSRLLPGHGGFLDRFDSFIFAAPAFYYALLLTGHFH